MPHLIRHQSDDPGRVPNGLSIHQSIKTGSQLSCSAHTRSYMPQVIQTFSAGLDQTIPIVPAGSNVVLRKGGSRHHRLGVGGGSAAQQLPPAPPLLHATARVQVGKRDAGHSKSEGPISWTPPTSAGTGRLGSGATAGFTGCCDTEQAGRHV